MSSVRREIATAVRWANVIYGQLPDDDARDDFGRLWVQLEREVTAAETAGDDLKVDRAIRDWRRTVTNKFGEASRG